MSVSVIIPTYNEEKNIGRLLTYLEQISTKDTEEILVVDGGSQDNTVEVANRYNVRVMTSPQKGRACQMNYGVSQAKGNILQFIHADTMPPTVNFEAIVKAVNDGFPVGCFTYRFDSWHPLLILNGLCTHLNMLWCRGGDQALFCTRKVFEAVGGYRSDYVIMEDFDFIEKVQARFPFKVIKKNGRVSARKYIENSYMQVQLANLKVFKMYKNGATQQDMISTYRRLLKLKD